MCGFIEIRYFDITKSKISISMYRNIDFIGVSMYRFIDHRYSVSDMFCPPSPGICTISGIPIHRKNRYFDIPEGRYVIKLSMRYSISNTSIGHTKQNSPGYRELGVGGAASIQGFSRVMTRPAGRVSGCSKCHGTGRAGSGQEVFKIPPVGSGQDVFKSCGSG